MALAAQLDPAPVICSVDPLALAGDARPLTEVNSDTNTKDTATSNRMVRPDDFPRPVPPRLLFLWWLIDRLSSGEPVSV
jgi:hypothetical protein